MIETIVFEPLFPDVEPPRRATEGSAGMDAVAYINDREVVTYHADDMPGIYRYGTAWIPPQGRALIPLGFKAKLPPGWECQVRPRSGLALKKGLTVLNAPGTIDADYPGEWGVMLHNTSSQIVPIKHGERIAQLVLAPVYVLPWEMGIVEQSTSRTGGFGSTGNG